MVTNEDMLSSYSDDAIRAIESSCRIDDFEGSFGNPNPWLLQTPFDATTAGIVPGMIARIVKAGFSPGPEFTYVIDAVSSSGFQLRLAGHATNVGRGPGSFFGTDAVKAKILDMKTVLERSTKIVESRFGTFRPEDKDVTEMKSEVIKRLAIVRAATDSEFLKMYMGDEEISLDRYEMRILDRLGSDLLHHLTRIRDGAMNWPRVRR